MELEPRIGPKPERTKPKRGESPTRANLNRKELFHRNRF